MEMTLTMNGFYTLTDDELLLVEGGNNLTKALWYTAGSVATAATYVATIGCVASGVAAPVAGGVFLIGTGAATYCFGRGSH